MGRNQPTYKGVISYNPFAKYPRTSQLDSFLLVAKENERYLVKVSHTDDYGLLMAIGPTH